MEFLGSGFCVGLMTGASVLSSIVFTLAQKVERGKNEAEMGRLFLELGTPSSGAL